ncbi:MAG: methyltransferase domain-containing protein [Candidatus Omnitrophota bacterium]|nr:MAG: methyltransferase domain-containing protein [Candidatus Omnitrophota bacterium]
MTEKRLCPSCGKPNINVFYKVGNVPVHSVLNLDTREKAIQYPKGSVELGFCQYCGFIFNTVFDPSLPEYTSGYEATQTFSPTFNAFHQKLATELIKRYGLRNKTVIEIGCGNGEFLTLLCKLGDNKGVGFDPSFNAQRLPPEGKNRVSFIKDFYSEKYSNLDADFIYSKMTLEHIHDPADFISMIRRSIKKDDTTVFFQLPEVRRILRDLAFWDIYYEHSSYFSRGSLARLFRGCGFDVLDLWTEYDNQYLMVTARINRAKKSTILSQEDDIDALSKEMDYFAKNTPKRIAQWRQKIYGIRDRGKRVVIWSASSKGVAFLTTLGIQDEIEYVVDINPYRQGYYMAGSGQRIVGPDFLKDYRPDAVIAMNPIYKEEIKNILGERELYPEVFAV